MFPTKDGSTVFSQKPSNSRWIMIMRSFYLISECLPFPAKGRILNVGRTRAEIPVCRMAVCNTNYPAGVVDDIKEEVLYYSLGTSAVFLSTWFTSRKALEVILDIDTSIKNAMYEASLTASHLNALCSWVYSPRFIPQGKDILVFRKLCRWWLSKKL